MRIPRVPRLARERAARWLQSAQRALEDTRWDDAVYSAQMCSEHAAKAVLLALGIEFPKQHDVSEVFVTLTEHDEMPPELRTDIPPMADILAELAAQRALAGYGFETEVDVSYFEKLAPKAVEKGKRVLKFADRFLERDSGA
ncbi:MAG: HEPN domain-containing protein [Thermoplasmata archaeon]